MFVVNKEIAKAFSFSSFKKDHVFFPTLLRTFRIFCEKFRQNARRFVITKIFGLKG